MLNIKEVHGLPDLHASHPAFRCRKKKITLGLWSITWTKNKYISVLKMHCFEDLRACCYLIMCNNCIQY